MVTCPGCRFETLTEHAAFEMCPICWWEDDGQGDHDAGVVQGGPNETQESKRSSTKLRSIWCICSKILWQGSSPSAFRKTSFLLELTVLCQNPLTHIGCAKQPYFGLEGWY